MNRNGHHTNNQVQPTITPAEIHLGSRVALMDSKLHGTVVDIDEYNDRYKVRWDRAAIGTCDYEDLTIIIK